MQIIRREQPPIQPLYCGGCRHWNEAESETNDGTLGECTRFKEMRTADMRPLCNICWEPKAVKRLLRPVLPDVQ